ncbi:hypothetical protein [Pseudokineococcus basanitobsidens]|uniref:hypothetical protein n=1 Tax=Pseudokineococcus basanitobsidens TaxID=1926649 RepID=UPI0030DA3555
MRVTGCGVLLAGLVLTSCGSGRDETPTDSASVSVCVPEESGQAGTRTVEVRQDGEVVGTVYLNPAGTAGIEVAPGPFDAYVDGELVGSGEVDAGGTAAFPCAAASSPGTAATTSD